MLKYYFFALWQAVVDHVLPLLAMLLLAILLPRIGRLVVRVIESRLDENSESTKARLALAGALVYVLQAVAFFLLALAALSNVGVPALGAAIPATVVSAAVGFGAQKIIGDFLAGFFILSEKQFGVGDYVSFDGVTGVEGTVVSLTLRTTKVRTPTGEVVMIPNGSAGVVTNYSQDWSRAVVDLVIPVREGETLPEITRQVEEISSTAIAEPSIAENVAGDLEILPATGIEAPTVAGQPWQVKYRILVQVNPARQWAVERAIRSALLSAFWDHYNLRPDAFLQGTSLQPGSQDAPLGDVPTTAFPASPQRGETGEAGVSDVVNAAVPDVDAQPPEDAAGGADGDAAVSAAEPDAEVTAKDHGPGRPAVPGEEDIEEEHRGIWRADMPTGRFQSLMTMGGRVRASTTGLFLGLAVTVVLFLASANPDGTDAGWLSPAHWKGSETSTPQTTQATQATQATNITDASQGAGSTVDSDAEPEATPTAAEPAPETSPGAAPGAASGAAQNDSPQGGQLQRQRNSGQTPSGVQQDTGQPSAGGQAGQPSAGPSAEPGAEPSAEGEAAAPSMAP